MPKEKDSSLFTEYPDEELSTTEFVLGTIDYFVDQMDLEVSTSREKILDRAEEISASDISGRPALEKHYPNINELFIDAFVFILETETLGDKINTKQLIEAYKTAVMIVRESTTRNFSSFMFMPLSIGNLFDFFGVPVHPDIVFRLEDSNPDLADQYKKRLELWTK